MSLRAAAQLAGVSHAAPYRHFRDKRALVAAIAERGFRMLTASMRAEAAPLMATDTRARARARSHRCRRPHLQRIRRRVRTRRSWPMPDPPRACRAHSGIRPHRSRVRRLPSRRVARTPDTGRSRFEPGHTALLPCSPTTSNIRHSCAPRLSTPGSGTRRWRTRRHWSTPHHSAGPSLAAAGRRTRHSTSP